MNKTITQTLIEAILQSGLTYMDLERATGVSRVSLMRFVRGAQSLRLDKADAVASLFNLSLRPLREDR